MEYCRGERSQMIGFTWRQKAKAVRGTMIMSALGPMPIELGALQTLSNGWYRASRFVFNETRCCMGCKRPHHGACLPSMCPSLLFRLTE
ncbi:MULTISPECIES: hypothetical protein [Mesorhizobium]|nr:MULTISPECIES: hypothetical protein [Mesorhizobium]